jgi:hypothetical protein
MNAEEAIEFALFGTVRDLSMFDADHKAWPNVSFEPPTDPYLRVDDLSNGNERVFIRSSAAHLYLGILQLTVVAPQNVGPSEAKRLAAAVAEAYPADRAVYDSAIKVRIEKAPDVMRPFLDETRWKVPVSIRYQAYAAPGMRGEGMLDFSQAQNSQYLSLIWGQ